MRDPTEFIHTHARLLERRLFEGRSVRDAVDAYRNADGGYGHALEPDVRVSTSQPIFVHYALTSLRDGGFLDDDGPAATCDWLDSVATDEGAVPYLLSDALTEPRAAHWSGDWCCAPSLIATTAVAGGLHALGVQHEWLDRATAWCLQQIDEVPEYSPHTIHNVLEFLHSLPAASADASRLERVTTRLNADNLVLMKTPVEAYGITPLQFAPTPKSPLRPLFDDAVIEAHLDDLESKQADDGGWPISWEPPAGSATHEWRGKWTVTAAHTLQAYGRSWD